MSGEWSDRTEVQGWATLADGSRVSLTPEECRAILADSDARKARRETEMPTEQDAIKVMMEAFTRLRELGWAEAIYCPKDGTSFKAIEAGSTGIHPCFYSGEWPNGYWMLGEGDWCGPSHPILYKLHPEDEAKRIARMEAVRARFKQDQLP